MNGPCVQVHRREGKRRSPNPGDLRAVDTPTACQSRPGQGPDRPSRPDRHAGPRGQEAGDDHLRRPPGYPGRRSRSSVRPGTCNNSWRARSLWAARWPAGCWPPRLGLGW